MEVVSRGSGRLDLEVVVLGRIDTRAVAGLDGRGRW